MSYRVLSYHKACLSLVRHGWLVVLLLGRRISSAKAISPQNSRWAPETAGGISIDKAGSVNCTSSTYSPLVWEIISPIRFSLPSLAYHVSKPNRAVWTTESDVGMKMSPLHCWNRLRANQSKLHLNIPTARPIVRERGRPLSRSQTSQRKHVPV